MKVCSLSAAADSDLAAAHAYYLQQSGPDLADGFLFDVDDALVHISLHPGTGSPRYAQASSNDGLRFWTLNRFPYALFYVEQTDVIDIVRVLHQACDIPNHLADT